jgi:signal transduction histidine kinase
MPEYKEVRQAFRPRARMLLLLGDQLIRDPGIAVFELVKNAYDADSPDCTVTMTKVADRIVGSISVEDSGTGMDIETVTAVWLEPGTDFRSKQRDQGLRTPNFHRSPIGEKGIGRFAAHKLGLRVRLTTRKKGRPEVHVDIDWERFEQKTYLADVAVKVAERKAELFTGSRTGTKIEITRLRNDWTRGTVRDLSRAVTSICSPFDESAAFEPHLFLTDPEESDWLRGLLKIDEVKDYALFRVSGRIEGDRFIYDYEFNPFAAMKERVQPRSEHGVSCRLQKREGRKSRILDLRQHSIGPLDVQLYIFDREPRILALGVTDKKGLRDFLDTVGGIRVYRDGIRVYNYAEPGDDWLGLDSRRVNIPTARISNNLVIGAVSLDLAQSKDLVEKTNREGFVDDSAFRLFHDAVLGAIEQIETERFKDKRRIRQAYATSGSREPVLADIGALRDLMQKREGLKEISPYLDRIEADFTAIRDRFLTSASAGLSLTIVIHEVEKGIANLVRAAKKYGAAAPVLELAKHLADLVEGLGALARRSGESREAASSLFRLAYFNTQLRLEAHKVRLTSNMSPDFEAKCSKRLVVATLMNLIDNAIWWLDNKWGPDSPPGQKRLFIGTSKDFAGGPAIVVADNGPGFIDPPEYLVEPFISRKPDGMGLGLHLADQVMKVQGGNLAFPERGDVSLPEGFDGAVVALVFGGGKWLG